MYYNIFFAIFSLCLLVSCGNESDILSKDDKESSVIVELMPTTRANNSANNLYQVKYKDLTLENIELSLSEVNLLRSAQSIDTVNVDVYGYSGWTKWESGKDEIYRRTFSSNSSVVQQCGIAPGTYFVRDVYLEQTYTLPTNLAILLDNNAAYTTLSAEIGWNPDNLDARGYRASLSGSTVSLKTAVYLLEYTAGGQQTLRTFPANIDNVVWKLKYIRINM